MPVPSQLSTSDPGPGGALLAAAEAADAVSRARLAGAGMALARAPELAVDDETRARARLIVDGVLTMIEGSLRGGEPMLDIAPPFDLPARFVAAGLFEQSGLAAAALLRAEEHRLAHALVRIAGEIDDLSGLDPIGGELVAERFALRAAEAARTDRTGEPLLPLHDINPEDRHAIVWHVAACLADAALASQGVAGTGNEDATHRAAASAVARCLAAVDDGDGVGPAAMRLAHALHDAGGIDDALVAGTLAAGRVAGLAAMLAVRAGIGFDEARAMLGAPPRAAVLMRAGGVALEVAAAMLVALALALDRGFGPDPLEVVGDLVEGYDELPVGRARTELRRTRLEPHYRTALAALDRMR